MAPKTRTLPAPVQIVTDHWATWRTSTLAAAIELDVCVANC